MRQPWWLQNKKDARIQSVHTAIQSITLLDYWWDCWRLGADQHSEAILWTIPTYLHTVCTYVMYVHTYIPKAHLNDHHIKKLMHPRQYCTCWLSGLDISKWPLVLFLTVVVMSHGQNMFWTKWLALNNLSRYPFWRWLTNRRVWVKF